MMKLNLGCGKIKKEGFINLDIDEKFNPEIVRDLKRGLPFSNDTFDLIHAEHILEHFDGEDFIFIMGEIHRVLKPNGVAEIELPDGRNAIIDPNHKLVCSPLVFNFFLAPDVNSISAGVKGYFKPLKIEYSDLYFRWFLEKIPYEKMEEYIKEHTDDEGKFKIEYPQEKIEK